MATNKYKCKVCGYIHEGNTPPDVCPKCNAPATEFELVAEKKSGINRDSNAYTIVYATVMVILVAIALAFTSQSLKDIQKKNVEIDKMMQILRSVNVQTTANTADTKFKELITESYLVKIDGAKVEGDAFNTNIVKAYACHDSTNASALPVFVANVDGKTKYIMAMYGSGLWGPIWGYISVDEDKNTVFGADLSHQGETPGLGAEIATTAFCSQFPGKQIFKNGEFKSIAVVKPGKEASGQDYVDGISGGTITSVGVDEMLMSSLARYAEFLKSNK